MQDPVQDSLSLDDLFIAVFLAIDDWYQAHAPACVRARRRNPTPATGCTDAELSTLALVGELVWTVSPSPSVPLLAPGAVASPAAPTGRSPANARPSSASVSIW